jgi:dipeptidyl aminopeptidase/acylaminoacyl peptidase
MAFSQSLNQEDLWNAGQPAWSKSPLSSTLREANPQFSPNGSRIAFSSTRSGASEIWTAAADGSHLLQLTTSRNSGTPRWSPDGRRIVYDSQGEDGLWDILTIDAGGGQPRQVPRPRADDKVPSFSGDGKWIYFASNRTGKDEIFRMPLAGGDPVQLTHAGGIVAFEAPGGKAFYYAKSNGCGSPLFRRDLQGGPELIILPRVCGRGFAVTESGIYYVDVADTARPGPSTLTLRLLDPTTGKSREISQSDRPLVGVNGLGVSPDGAAILVSASPHWGSDLFLLEHFR